MSLFNVEEQKKFEGYLQSVSEKLEWVCENNKNGIPYTTLPNGQYDNQDFVNENSIDGGVNWWTNGFFGGILWQMFQLTGEEKYKEYARIQEDKLDQCLEIFEGVHHDVGFMWGLTALADYKLTGDIKAKRRALHAATILAGRFNVNGEYIRAWNSYAGENNGLAIIDCLMNVSLLYWASEELKDPRFAEIAKRHTKTTIKHFIREDGSTNHIVEFDPYTGNMVKSHGGQGYGQGSCWTRGLSWAVYGFTNGYRNTGDKEFLNAAIKVSDYFISRLTDSYLVPVDFNQPAEDNWEDSSAACITASGLLELSKLLPKEEGEKYLTTALKLLETLMEKRVCLDNSSEALVHRCRVAYHDKSSIQTLIYADYYLLEALMKVDQKALMVW